MSNLVKMSFNKDKMCQSTGKTKPLGQEERYRYSNFCCRPSQLMAQQQLKLKTKSENLKRQSKDLHDREKVSHDLSGNHKCSRLSKFKPGINESNNAEQYCDFFRPVSDRLKRSSHKNETHWVCSCIRCSRAVPGRALRKGTSFRCVSQPKLGGSHGSSAPLVVEVVHSKEPVVAHGSTEGRACKLSSCGKPSCLRAHGLTNNIQVVNNVARGNGESEKDDAIAFEKANLVAPRPVTDENKEVSENGHGSTFPYNGTKCVAVDEIGIVELHKESQNDRNSFIKQGPEDGKKKEEGLLFTPSTFEKMIDLRTNHVDETNALEQHEKGENHGPNSREKIDSTAVSGNCRKNTMINEKEVNISLIASQLKEKHKLDSPIDLETDEQSKKRIGPGTEIQKNVDLSFALEREKQIYSCIESATEKQSGASEASYTQNQGTALFASKITTKSDSLKLPYIDQQSVVSIMIHSYTYQENLASIQPDTCTKKWNLPVAVGTEKQTDASFVPEKLHNACTIIETVKQCGVSTVTATGRESDVLVVINTDTDTEEESNTLTVLCTEKRNDSLTSQGDASILPSTDTEKQGDASILPSTDTEKQGDASILPSINTEKKGDALILPSTDTEKQGDASILPNKNIEKQGDASILPSRDKEKGGVPVLPSTDIEKQGDESSTHVAVTEKQGDTSILPSTDTEKQVDSSILPSSDIEKLGDASVLPSTDIEKQDNASILPSTYTEKQGDASVLPCIDTEKQGDSSILPSRDTEKQGDASILPSKNTEKLGDALVLSSTDIEKLGDAPVLSSTETEKRGDAAVLPNTDTEKQGDESTTPGTVTDKQGDASILPSADTDKKDDAPVLPCTDTEKQVYASILPSTDTEKQGDASFLPNKNTEKQGDASFLPNKNTEKQGDVSFLPNKNTEKQADASVVPNKNTEKQADASVVPNKNTEKQADASILPSTDIEKQDDTSLVSSTNTEKKGDAAVLPNTEKHSNTLVLPITDTEKQGDTLVLPITEKQGDASTIPGTDLDKQGNVSIVTEEKQADVLSKANATMKRQGSALFLFDTDADRQGGASMINKLPMMTSLEADGQSTPGCNCNLSDADAFQENDSMDNVLSDSWVILENHFPSFTVKFDDSPSVHLQKLRSSKTREDKDIQQNISHNSAWKSQASLSTAERSFISLEWDYDYM